MNDERERSDTNKSLNEQILFIYVRHKRLIGMDT